jgi:hypothetical protein
VPEGGEVLDHLAHPARAVHHHRRDALDLAVEEHKRGLFGDGAHLVVVHARAAQHHAVHLLGHLADEAQLGGRVLVAVGEEHGEVVLAGPGLDTVEHAGEERVAQVGDHDAEKAGPRSRGPVRTAGGVVAELARGGQDPAACLVFHQVRRGEGPRHGGDGDVRPSGDVVDGHRHRHSSAQLHNIG